MTRGKIQRWNNVRVPMRFRGPLVRSNGGTALQNDTNLRQVEADYYSSQSTRHMNLNVHQFQLVQEPMLPSVSYNFAFLMGDGVYRVIIERALANSDRLGYTYPLLVGRSFANH